MAPTLSFSIVATGRDAAEEAAQDAKGSPATLGGAANPQGLTALLLVVAWVMRVGEQEEALGGGLHDLLSNGLTGTGAAGSAVVVGVGPDTPPPAAA